MGAKDWSPTVSKYLVVSGNMEEGKVEESDLIMVGAMDLKEVDHHIDQGMSMGAETFFIFERTDPASIWDGERFIERPVWKLIRAI